MKMKRGLSWLVVLCMALSISGLALATDVVLDGTIAEVDKYGNLTLDITSDAVKDAGWNPGDILTIEVGDEALEAPLGTSYSDVDTGNVVVRDKQTEGVGLIVAINMGNFGETYGVGAGDPVVISMLEPAGYLEEYEIRQLAQNRTNERADYASDEIFANFRNIKVGEIGEGKLYRSSSPINNELGRAAFADDQIEAVSVATVINLADSKEVAEGYFAEEGFDSPYYKGLYDAGQVITLDMGVDFSTDDFKTKLAEGLRFMAAHEGPFLVHCNEGKDRAGFVSMLLEALMGATVEEMKADYMESFTNYYHVELGSEQYEKTAESNIMGMLRDLAGLEKGASLDGVDLQAAAKEYLAGIGLTGEEITALEDALKG